MLGKAYANASMWPILYRKRPTAMLMVALELPECTSGRWGEVFCGCNKPQGNRWRPEGHREPMNVSKCSVYHRLSILTVHARCLASRDLWLSFSGASRHEDVLPRFVPPAPVAALEEHLAAAQEPKLVVRRTFLDLEVGFPSGYVGLLKSNLMTLKQCFYIF